MAASTFLVPAKTGDSERLHKCSTFLVVLIVLNTPPVPGLEKKSTVLSAAIDEIVSSLSA